MVAAVVAAGPPTLIEFELTDQFDRTYRGSDYAERVLYVVGSDKNGSQFNSLWAGAIFDALKEDHETGALVSFGVADLSGVPFFLKKLIKGKFPQDEDQWVLMDWQGRFDKAYGFEPDSANVLVFDAAGRLALQAHGREVDPELLERILAELRRLLNRP